MTDKSSKEVSIPAELIERRIYLIRGQKVMLASDLADIYGVPTKSLNLAVRRNKDRFPEDFMFQLTKEEAESLRFQFETSNEGRGGRRYLPYAFTEHGVAMLSSVLRSSRAVKMNILIVRAFVKLREVLATHKDLDRAIEDIRRKQEEQGEQRPSLRLSISCCSRSLFHLSAASASTPKMRKRATNHRVWFRLRLTTSLSGPHTSARALGRQAHW